MPAIFRSLANRVHVRDSERAVLASKGIETADEFFFRYPNERSLEDWIEQYLYRFAGGYAADDTPQIYDRNDGGTIAEFKSSEEVAGVRRLWLASMTLAKRDMDTLTADVQDDRPRRISTALINDAFGRAASRGLIMANDRLKPSDGTMSKVMENYRIGGSFRYIEWEEYVSKQDEEDAHEQGMKPKAGYVIVRCEKDSLQGREETKLELRRKELGDKQFTALEDVLRLRAIGFDVAELATKNALDVFTEILINALRDHAARGYRPPTLAEGRLFDKLVFNDINRQVSQGFGSVEEGLTWFMSEDGKLNKVWKLLEQMPEYFPDRGTAKPVIQVSMYDTEAGEYKNQQTSDSSERTSVKRKVDSESPAQMSGTKPCRVCGEMRKDHPNRSFDGCNKKARAKAKGGKGASSSASAGDRNQNSPAQKGGKATSGVKVPDSMKTGCARREPPSDEHEDGLRFCFDFHDPTKKCERGKTCKLSHRCPKMVSGRVCMEPHPVYEH